MAVSGPRQGHQHEHRQQILVVDDEPSIVDAVSTALRYEGFDVREAGTGRAALSAAQEAAPDLIVLDVMLPDLDGFEVCRRLRADGVRIPVLFLTARDATEDKVRGLTLGGDDSIVESYISYLRRKVDVVEPRLIHTLRGVGYVLRLPA